MFNLDGLYGDGMNLYGYLGSNPTNGVDPLGLADFDWFAEADEVAADIIGNRAATAKEAFDKIGVGFNSALLIGELILSVTPGGQAVVLFSKLATGNLSIEELALGVVGGVVAGKALRFIGKNIIAKYRNIRAKYRAGNRGVAIRNARLAGQRHPRTGVQFDSDGFPDFSSYAKAEARVGQSGNRVADVAAANAAAGYRSTPAGFTWHHHQDGITMQLVPTTIHRATGHTGGAALWP
jgi:HNH/ENDO VII superfamily nuclease